jgi:serine/threonine protein kinase
MTFDNYTVLEKIAQGAMGEVFLVEDKQGDRYALKTLRTEEGPDTKERNSRFQREVDLCRRLKHDSIVKVSDFNHDHKPPYMVMEYMKNGSLELRLKRQTDLEPLEVLNIAIQMTESLKEMESLDLTHRDIKPGNILIAEDGRYKLSDLGLAGLVIRDDQEDLTIAGTSLGTPHYIAPEQALNARNVDIRADIYSLGATLYHCFTGQKVHEGTNSVGIMLKHLNEEIVSPRQLHSELPENISAVIMKMLQKDVKDRYQSPNSLLNDLLKIRDYDAPMEDLIASRMSLNLPRSSNRTGQLMFICFSLLLFFALYGVFQSTYSPPDQTNKYYLKNRLEVKKLKVEQTAQFLTDKAIAVEHFLISYSTDPEKERMKMAAETAMLLATRQTYHLTVKKVGNLKTAGSFASRLFVGGIKIFDYETSEQRKFIYPDSRVVFKWRPKMKVRVELEDFELQNEIIYNSVLADFFSLRGLSGERFYRISEATNDFFNDDLLHLEFELDEISEEQWQAFEDYIYPGKKW